MALYEAKVLLETGNLLGEGIAWDTEKERLLWIDIEGRAIHQYLMTSGEQHKISLKERIGCLVMRKGGGFLAGMESGIYALEEGIFEGQVEENAQMSWEVELEQLFVRFAEEKDGNRCNDGKCDPEGRFFVGTMAIDQSGPESRRAGKLYCVQKDGSYQVVERDIGISNGLAWDVRNHRMYYIDTLTQEVWAYDYERESGLISKRQTAYRVDPAEGSPDGMTIDVEGNLWIALWGGGKVICVDPTTGTRLHEVKVGTPLVTCCCFGGKDLSTLYITTASVEISEEERKSGAGHVYYVETNTKGENAWRQ